jgi:hypothetical protein
MAGLDAKKHHDRCGQEHPESEPGGILTKQDIPPRNNLLGL